MYMGTLGINIHFHSINCPILTQFKYKILMSINRVAINFFFNPYTPLINDPHTVSMEEFDQNFVSAVILER